MNNKEIGINFFGPIYTEDGIGEAARLTLQAFKKTGIKIAVNPLSRPVAKETNQIKISDIKAPYGINYFHFSSRWVEYYLNLIGKKVLLNRYNVGYWVTEVQDYPMEWAKNHIYFNEIWTASSFCQNSISQKISVPTILMPHPIYCTQTGQLNKPQRESPFTFLTMANMYSDIERKNILQSIRAFQLAFNSNENVSMIVKITNPDVDTHYMQNINKLAFGDSRIKVIRDFISREKIDNLFGSVDAYVSLHRAEGFGLTIGEAMCHGVPVITTAYSGNMDFCNCFNSFLVDYNLVKVGQDRLRYKKDDVWAAPLMESAVEMFQRVYFNKDEVKQKISRAKKTIKENFSIDQLSKKILDRLEIIHNGFIFTGSFGEHR